MFDFRTKRDTRLTDAVDLLIDFATLGEYGLEPIDRAAPPCEARRRSGTLRSTGAWNAAINRFATHS